MATTSDFTRRSWAADLLTRLGFPVTNKNVAAIVAWERAEGGNFQNSARFNPLNTTLPMRGSTPMNGVGVQSYPDYETGMQATIRTLLNGSSYGYNKILSVLQNDQGPQSLALAVGSTPWGTPASGIQGNIQSAISEVGSVSGSFDTVPTGGDAQASLAGWTAHIPNPVAPFQWGLGEVQGIIGGVGSSVAKDMLSVIFSSAVGKLFVRGVELVAGSLLFGAGLVVGIKILGDTSGASQKIKTAAETGAVAAVAPEAAAVVNRTKVAQGERRVRRSTSARQGETTSTAVRRHQREQRSRYNAKTRFVLDDGSTF